MNREKIVSIALK